MRPVPRGMFAESVEAPGRPALAGRPIVPLDWLMSHPATWPWWGKAIRFGVGAAFVTDTALILEPSFEAVITFMKLIGHSDIQGSNGGINWQILVNRVPIFRARRQFGGNLDAGFIDDLGEGDGFGNTWGEIRVWIEEGATVQVTYNNNGGGTDSLGWILRGYAWPVNIREEWLARGWRK